MLIMSKIIKYEYEDRGANRPPKQIPIVECNCGSFVECYDSWTNDCVVCHTEYNGSGQELAPRSFWGEETGEIFK